MDDLILADAYGKTFPIDARNLHERLGVGRDFSTWIKERIERFSFMEDVDYSAKEDLSSPDLGNAKARPQTLKEYSFSIPAAKMIAAIENSNQGREILRYLVKVEEAWNTPEMVLVRAKQAAEAIIDRQKRYIATLEPDARMAHVLTCARGRKTITEFAKISGVPPQKMFELLSLRRIIYRRNGSWLPYQEYIEAGYFIVREAPYGNEEHEHLYSQTYVSGKGELWLAKRLFPVTESEHGVVAHAGA